MQERPERQLSKNPGSLRAEANSLDAISGSFGVIRVIVVPSTACAMGPKRKAQSPGDPSKTRWYISAAITDR
jgi:hypothetical protein